MDVDTEELRLVYEAFSVRELKDELTSRGLRADGVRSPVAYTHPPLPSSLPSFPPSFLRSLSLLCLPAWVLVIALTA